jgi:hypothetical protein
MKNLATFSAASIVFACLLLAGCQPPPLFSYPWFWDHTKTRPMEADVLGIYEVSNVRLTGTLATSVREKHAAIALLSDHTATFISFPVFDDSGEKLACALDGSATSKLFDQTTNLGGWSVMFENYNPTTKSGAKECQLEDSSWSILLLSRHAPYRLYDIVGDPDSDTGIEYKKK